MAERMQVNLVGVLNIAIMGIENGKTAVALEVLKDAREQLIEHEAKEAAKANAGKPGGMKHG